MLLSQVHEVEEVRGFCDYPQSNSPAFTSHGEEEVDETPPKRVRVACDHCKEDSSSMRRLVEKKFYEVNMSCDIDVDNDTLCRT